MVCYDSRKLNGHEQNYVTHDLELVVIIHALKMWRHYLISRRFILNVRKFIWLAILNDFYFEIGILRVRRIGFQMLSVRERR